MCVWQKRENELGSRIHSQHVSNQFWKLPCFIQWSNICFYRPTLALYGARQKVICMWNLWNEHWWRGVVVCRGVISLTLLFYFKWRFTNKLKMKFSFSIDLLINLPHMIFQTSATIVYKFIIICAPYIVMLFTFIPCLYNLFTHIHTFLSILAKVQNIIGKFNQVNVCIYDRHVTNFTSTSTEKKDCTWLAKSFYLYLFFQVKYI